jgi:hypothetical protein
MNNSPKITAIKNRTENPKYRVVISVLGGVAYVDKCP